MFLKVVFLLSLPRDEVSHFATFPYIRAVVSFQKNHFTLTRSSPSAMYGSYIIIYFQRNRGIIHLANPVKHLGHRLLRPPKASKAYSFDRE